MNTRGFLSTPDALADALADLEALLFAASRPLGLAEIGRRLSLEEPNALALLSSMQDELARPGRGLQLREAAGKWRLETRADREDVVSALRRERSEHPLSSQALEALAAVALRQPITTEEVTAIRGSESYATLETLHRRKLIARAEQHGEQRAGRWRTTRHFLDLFGLRHPSDIVRSKQFTDSWSDPSGSRP